MLTFRQGDTTFEVDGNKMSIVNSLGTLTIDLDSNRIWCHTQELTILATNKGVTLDSKSLFGVNIETFKSLEDFARTVKKVQHETNVEV